MFWAIKQLSTPLSYLRIRNGIGLFHSKRTYDIVIPFILAAITMAVFYTLGISLSVFDHNELVKRILDLLALMIVFYMAALAAVATFERKGIDQPLKGDDALLWVRHNDGGTWVEKKLTYRQFISYVFGFLSFLALILYVLIIIMAVAWPEIKKILCDKSFSSIKVIDPLILFLLSFLVWELVITSLLGIYFLTERIQTLSDAEN